MKIAIKDLRQKQSIVITGEEPWLEGIYSEFPPPKGQMKPLVTGNVEIFCEEIEGAGYRVKGEIAYEPFVECSRCGDIKLQWPVSASFDVVFLAPDLKAMAHKEINLSEEELNDYFIDNGQIDLELLINDYIQMGIPQRTLKESEDGESCLTCGVNLDEDRVYGEEKSEDDSPFAALKGLIR